jgi:hypothetical protein
MADATAQAYISRWQQLSGQWESLRVTYQELERYLLPGRGALALTQMTANQEPDWARVTEGTGVLAADLLTGALAGGLTAPGAEWFSLTLRDPALAEDGEVQAWLEDTTGRMHAALSESNVYQELQAVYQELVVFGTGALFLDQRPPTAAGAWGGFVARALPMGTYVVDEGRDGRVDTVIQKMTLTARACVMQWGDGAVGDEIRRQAEDKPDTPIEILHVMQPGSLKEAEDQPTWKSCYVAIQAQRLVDEAQYFELPAMVARWAKRAGDRWGRGPGHTALADVRTLNQIEHNVLKALPLAIQPPTVELEEGLVTAPDQRPAGRNVEKIPNAIRFLDTKFRLDVAGFGLEDKRKAIRECFYWSRLLLRPDTPQRTATEVQLEWQQAQRVFGPTLQRLQAELHRPLLERAFRIMARAGALAPMPEALQAAAKNADLDVQFESPLERAQRSGDLVAIDQVVMSTLQMAQAWPEVIDLIDADAVQRARARLTGAPSDIIRPQRQVALRRQQRAQMDQQQRMLQQGQQMADIAGTAAPALKDLGEVGQMIQGRNGGGAQPEAA